jgi:hypothetical protein
LKDSKPNSELRTARGDTEGLVHHSSPSGSILNFPWVDFLVMSTLTFLLLEFLFGTHSSPPIIPFLYDIKSSETEIPVESIENIIPLVGPNWFAIGLMGAGALMLSGSIFLSYYYGHP